MSLLPKNGVDPYENHPGFVADACPIRMTITRRNGSFIQGGFSCEVTGGHCLPGEFCDSRRETARHQDEMAVLFAQAQANGAAV